jgi:hypothetical protein
LFKNNFISRKCKREGERKREGGRGRERERERERKRKVVTLDSIFSEELFCYFLWVH